MHEPCVAVEVAAGRRQAGDQRRRMFPRRTKSFQAPGRLMRTVCLLARVWESVRKHSESRKVTVVADRSTGLLPFFRAEDWQPRGTPYTHAPPSNPGRQVQARAA